MKLQHLVFFFWFLLLVEMIENLLFFFTFFLLVVKVLIMIVIYSLSKVGFKRMYEKKKKKLYRSRFENIDTEITLISTGSYEIN